MQRYILSFVVETLKKLGKDHSHRECPKHAKEVGAYLWHRVFGIEAVGGRALGTRNTLQNSTKTQRKKSIGI